MSTSFLIKAVNMFPSNGVTCSNEILQDLKEIEVLCINEGRIIEIEERIGNLKIRE